MYFDITSEQLERWCSIPLEKLLKISDLKAKIQLDETKEATMQTIGNMMANEIIQNNNVGKLTKWILPAGPMEEYTTFIDRVNRERISLHSLYVFHMDEFLDWEGRPYPVAETFQSLRGTMLYGFYARIDPELNVPEAQRIWPDIYDIEAFDRKVDELGGIDTIWAGIGYKGLVAFCESPHFHYHRITEEQFINGKTKIVEINDDTIVALSQRTFGGMHDLVPPKAISIGMKSILTSKRVVFMITTGSWKQTIVRVLLFGEPTLEYPVTYLTHYIPERVLCVDRFTVEHPLAQKIKLW